MSASSNVMPQETKDSKDSKTPDSQPKKRKIIIADCVLVIDETGSMGPYIDQVKENLTKLMQNEQKDKKDNDVEVRRYFAVTAYKDYADLKDEPLSPNPESCLPLCKRLDLTNDTQKAVQYVKELRHSGGGDTPEAIEMALWAARNKITWHKKGDEASLKIPSDVEVVYQRTVVCAWDAPAHAVNKSGDDYKIKEKNPSGLYWKTEVDKLREELGVNIHVLSCKNERFDDPVDEEIASLEDFGDCIARHTGGTHLSLNSDANLFIAAINKAIVGDSLANERIAQLLEGVDTTNPEKLKEVEEKIAKDPLLRLTLEPTKKTREKKSVNRTSDLVDLLESGAEIFKAPVSKFGASTDEITPLTLSSSSSGDAKESKTSTSKTFKPLADDDIPFRSNFTRQDNYRSLSLHPAPATANQLLTSSFGSQFSYRGFAVTPLSRPINLHHTSSGGTKLVSSGSTLVNVTTSETGTDLPAGSALALSNSSSGGKALPLSKSSSGDSGTPLPLSNSSSGGKSRIKATPLGLEKSSSGGTSHSTEVKATATETSSAPNTAGAALLLNSFLKRNQTSATTTTSTPTKRI